MIKDIHNFVSNQGQCQVILFLDKYFISGFIIYILCVCIHAIGIICTFYLEMSSLEGQINDPIIFFSDQIFRSLPICFSHLDSDTKFKVQ